MNKRRAILFDLDGTLVNSIADLTTIANRRLAALGRVPVDAATIQRLVGDGARSLLKCLFIETGGEVSDNDFETVFAAYMADYNALRTSSKQLYPDVPRILGELNAGGWKLGLCTNKPSMPTARLLEDTGLIRSFAAVMTGDDLPWRKPDPRPLLTLAETLAVPPESCVMVGDDDNDFQAAKAAGIKMIYATYGYARDPSVADHADAVIDSFAQLPSAIAMLS
ncbi:MAG: phosphoglycolate phosphatase [Pseudomonadota bacterium]|nr:phosphoglycolate phosphatase [Pseudomonadota bacterium]